MFPILNSMTNTNSVLYKTKSLIKTGKMYNTFINEYNSIVIKPSYKLPDIHSYPLLKNLEYVSLCKYDYYKGFNTNQKEQDYYNLENLDFNEILKKRNFKGRKLTSLMKVNPKQEKNDPRNMKELDDLRDRRQINHNSSSRLVFNKRDRKSVV